MVWWIKPQEIAEYGKGTGKWRMTATSDEGGGGPYGNTDCFHESAEEAENCEACDEYTSSMAGFPSQKKQKEQQEQREKSELKRLKEKYPEE